MRWTREATGWRIRVAKFDSGLSHRIFFTTGKLNKMLPSRPFTGFAQAALKGRYQPIRQFASAAPTAAFAGQKGSNGKYTVTLIPGDGIGPEISQF